MSAPNKMGASFKLLYEIANTDPAFLYRISGAQYVKSSSPKQHAPWFGKYATPYSGKDVKGDDILSGPANVSNQVGVTQGMCMGVSLPGRKGTINLDPTNPDSGAQLYWDAWHLPAYSKDGKEDSLGLVFLSLLWLGCTSPVHTPFENTKFVASSPLSPNGYNQDTYTFFIEWAQFHSYNPFSAEGLRQASQEFIMAIAMGSGYSPAENFLMNTWQNTTIWDCLMSTLAWKLGYDLIQLNMDVSENNMWTRECLALKLPGTWFQMATEQTAMEGPHGGCFLYYCQGWGTHYNVDSPSYVNRTDGQKINPMPFYRGAPMSLDGKTPNYTDSSIYAQTKKTWVYPYGSAKCGGPPPTNNAGPIITGNVWDTKIGDTPKNPFPTAQSTGGSLWIAHEGSPGVFAAESKFTVGLFRYYADNAILTARDPMDTFRALTDDESTRALASQQDWANRMYDRALCGDYPSLTPCGDIWKSNPKTGSGQYMADSGGTTYSGSFDPGVPAEKRGQRCFGPLCAFYADGSQTKAWARPVLGLGFG